MKFPLIYSISNPLGQQSCSRWKQSNWEFYKESGTGQESQMHFKSSKPFHEPNGEPSAPTARAVRKQFYKIIQKPATVFRRKTVLLCQRDLYPFLKFLFLSCGGRNPFLHVPFCSPFQKSFGVNMTVEKANGKHPSITVAPDRRYRKDENNC